MLRLLDSILAHLPRLFPPLRLSRLPCLRPRTKAGMSTSGASSRATGATQLFKDRVSACETPAQHPIYWAPTFDDAVQYLPRCRGFETAFGFGSEDPELFFVVDWDPHVYYDSYAAENAWQHQGEKRSAVFVTMSWNDAWVRAQRWPTDYSEHLHAM
ncbi:hypothetical protein B0H14DRAFT_3467645 [Mycena olivaceomarginata]|nr:hypothetical protein B0H14DRAFT_3467645 [Mycena olivaceomarginata]